MIEITIYDRATGAILRAGSLPDVANASANVGEGEGWIPGQWDGNTHYVRDGQVVPRLIPAIDTIRPERDRLLAASDWTKRRQCGRSTPGADTCSPSREFTSETTTMIANRIQATVAAYPNR